MKHCHTCGRNYADDTLRFCLEDGTPLDDVAEQPTVIRPGEQGSYKTEKLPSNITTPSYDAMRAETPPADKRTSQITVPSSGAGFPWLKLIVAVLAIGFVVVLGAGLLGVAFYVGSGNKDQSELKTASPTPKNTPHVSPTDDKQKTDNDDTADSKNKTEDDSDNPFDDLGIPSDIGSTAEVNSPKDGFLALRNLPNVDLGTRIAKIPHGATINVIMCANDTVTIDTRSGHWCMVSYNDQAGWIFDAWIIKHGKK
jgi:hypothetical protein